MPSHIIELPASTLLGLVTAIELLTNAHRITLEGFADVHRELKGLGATPEQQQRLDAAAAGNQRQRENLLRTEMELAPILAACRELAAGA